ncbi:MAG: hypothetical protein IPK80_12540 [Nannocystis sp.]|jgi:hypothetical protein|nr:hypothetical protein [Nannocystis sp.]
MALSPLQQVKKLYGSKENLIQALTSLHSPAEGESTEDFSARLKHVANAKLLRLVRIGEAVKEIGGRDALVAKVAELRGHAKDKDYLGKLGSFASPKLLDMYRALSRRAKQAAKAASKAS